MSSVLVTVSGPDRPGVTAALCADLAAHGDDLLDIEQVTVGGLLALALHLDPARGADVGTLRERLAALPPLAGMTVAAAAFAAAAAPDRLPAPAAHDITLLGAPVSAAAVAAVAAAVAATGANIERISRLASTPVTAYELSVRGGRTPALRAALAAVAGVAGVDVAVQEAGSLRRSKRLLVLDVDSTLIAGEVIEMLAAHAGCAEDVAAVTARAMAGELDFEASLRERVARLAGVPASALDEVAASVRLTPGARTLIRTVKRLGFLVGVVSGGFTQVVDPLAASLQLDFARANTLEIRDGQLTGRLLGPVVDRAAKAAALREFAARHSVPLDQTVAVGDGANDIDMLATAGLGVAFNASARVRDVADASLSLPYLDTLLFVLGLHRSDIEAGDQRDGAAATPPASVAR